MNIAWVPPGENWFDKIFWRDSERAQIEWMQVCMRYFADRGDRFECVEWYDNLDEVDYFFFINMYAWSWKWYYKILKKGLEDRTIYFMLEPEVVHASHSLSGYDKYKKLFRVIVTWNEEIIQNKGAERLIPPYYFDAPIKKNDNVPYSDRRFLVSISADKKSTNVNELYSERRRVIDFYESNPDLEYDFWGYGWPTDQYKNYKGPCENKYEVLSNYKYAICFENVKNVRGGISEKIFDCFISGVVPVYYGVDNVQDYIPDNTFIDYRKFGDPESLQKYLASLTESDWILYRKNIDVFLNSKEKDYFSPEMFCEKLMLITKTSHT